MDMEERVEPNFATVLVVETSPGDAMAMRRMLGVFGLRTIVLVDSAERALAFLSRESCDLILTEYALRDTNGVHLIESVRRLYPETPVVMVSGINDERLIAAAIAAGAADFIPKDARLQADLFKAIRAALAPKPRQAKAVREEQPAEHGPGATTRANIDANWLVDPFTEGTHLDAFERSTLLHTAFANEQWATAVNEFTEYIRVCVDPLGTSVRVREDGLLRTFIDNGLGPKEILAVFRGAVHELTVDPLFAVLEPRVSLSAVLARILCRWGQDYQWQLWLQINEPAA
jgi:DNA-binding NarL/FixJ family response regulator